jgi:hypothetical protein
MYPFRWVTVVVIKAKAALQWSHGCLRRLPFASQNLIRWNRRARFAVYMWYLAGEMN